MPTYLSAAKTAQRLDVSKVWLLMCVKANRVRPAPIKVDGKPNSPWLFAPTAKIIDK